MAEVTRWFSLFAIYLPALLTDYTLLAYHKIMNGQIPNPPSPTPPSGVPEEKRSPVPNGTGKGFLFKIIFAVVFLVILLGILNYFIILRLSEIFPNYLGWLPHKPYEQQSQQPSNVTLSPDEQAKQMITDYLPLTINPSFLPQSINLNQDANNKNRFNVSWDTEQDRLTADFHMPDDFKKIASLDLYAQRLREPLSLSTESAKSTVSQIFSVKPEGEWGCKNVVSSRLYCENFWDEEDSKKGLGFLIVTATGSSRLVFSFCEHTKESKYYSWKSCKADFAQTGVQ